MQSRGKSGSSRPVSRPSIEQILIERAKTYRYAILLGISVGAVFCASGFVLALLGLAGAIEFFFEAGGIKARLANASPGAIFALLGMLVIWRYKPKMHDDLSTQGRPTEDADSVTRTAVFRAGRRAESGVNYEDELTTHYKSSS